MKEMFLRQKNEDVLKFAIENLKHQATKPKKQPSQLNLAKKSKENNSPKSKQRVKNFIDNWQRKSTCEPTKPLHNKGREDLNFEKTGGKTTTNPKQPSNPRPGEPSQ